MLPPCVTYFQFDYFPPQLLGLVCVSCVVTRASVKNFDDDDESQQPLKRVEIRVFRGPYDRFHGYAPWGYFVRQPADD